MAEHIRRAEHRSRHRDQPCACTQLHHVLARERAKRGEGVRGGARTGPKHAAAQVRALAIDVAAVNPGRVSHFKDAHR